MAKQDKSVLTADNASQLVGASTFKANDKFLFGIVLGVITFWLFAQSVVNIVPDLQRTTNIPLESLNLAISLTALFSGCFIVVAGGLADRVGRVKFTYLGFILSIIGSLCLILAKDEYLFALGRIIQGLSAAFIMPATLALIKTYYEGADRQRALSFWSIGSWGGSGVCSLAGGAIATYMGWQWIFILSIVCAVVGMLLIYGVPESKAEGSKETQKFDYSGLVCFVVALVSLNLVITKGGSFGWTSSTTLGLIGLFAAAVVIFFIVEFRLKTKAFIDFSLFKNMPYSGASFSNFMLNAVAGTLIVANSYVQQGLNFTPFQTGMLSIGYLIVILCMIRVGEKILQKVGARKPMLWGTIVTGTGVALMALTFLPQTIYVVAVFVGYMMFGLGLGLYATPSTDTAISNAPADRVGVASGIYKMASSLGGAFGVAISAAVYTALKATGDIQFAAAIGLWVNVGFCVLSVLSIFFMVPKNAGMNR
ncbi:MFS transporter [Microvirga sp. W0021]|uniref:MFS transporter n=1 Tax=Hohaiivirga grylli TaxID=3133970 RepID=A0ABV0BLS9_9HYPH